MTNTMTTDTESKIITPAGMRTLARLVAIRLGGRWTAVDPYGNHDVGYVRLEHDCYGHDVRRRPMLYISLVKGRVMVHVTAPWSEATGVVALVGYNQTAPKISIDAKRVEVTPNGALIVANAITSRLLPIYLPLHAAALAKIKSHEEHRDSGKAIADRLAAGTSVVRSSGRSHTFSVETDSDRYWGEVTASGDRVSIDLRNLSETQASAILRVVRGG